MMGAPTTMALPDAAATRIVLVRGQVTALDEGLGVDSRVTTALSARSGGELTTTLYENSPEVTFAADDARGEQVKIGSSRQVHDDVARRQIGGRKLLRLYIN
jgi:hypothetical protein